MSIWEKHYWQEPEEPKVDWRHGYARQCWRRYLWAVREPLVVFPKSFCRWQLRWLRRNGYVHLNKRNGEYYWRGKTHE